MFYSKPTRLHPNWTAGYLVYQGGVARVRTADQVGGGNVFARDYSGTFQPVVMGYATRTQSLSGSGNVLQRPGFLTRLLSNGKTKA